MHALRPERAIRRHGWRHAPQPDGRLAALLAVAALVAGEVPCMWRAIWSPWRLRRDTVLMTGHRDLRVLSRVYYAPDMQDVASKLD